MSFFGLTIMWIFEKIIEMLDFLTQCMNLKTPNECFQYQLNIKAHLYSFE